MSDMSNIDRAIKKSSEDTSGFEPLRRSPDRLKSGNTFDICRGDVLASVGGLGDYSHCIVIDYLNHDDIWDHNLVNFYFTNEEDPTTTIRAFRWYQDGTIESC